MFHIFRNNQVPNLHNFLKHVRTYLSLDGLHLRFLAMPNSSICKVRLDTHISLYGSLHIVIRIVELLVHHISCAPVPSPLYTRHFLLIPLFQHFVIFIILLLTKI